MAALAATLSCLAPAAAHAASVSLQPAGGPAGSTATLRGAGLGAGRTATVSAGGVSARVRTDRSGIFAAPVRIARDAHGWVRVTTRLGGVRVVNSFRVGAPVDNGEAVDTRGALMRWLSLSNGTVRFEGARMPRSRAVAVWVMGRRRAAGRTTPRGVWASSLTVPAGAHGLVAVGRVRLPFTAARATAARPVGGGATSAVPASAVPGAVTAPGAAGDAEPTFPIRAAFYYPWFPQAWNQGGQSRYTHFTPSLGWYDSGDTAAITRHLDELRYAHVQVGISSWWGQGHWTDRNLPTLLSTTKAVGSPLRWAVYYEPEGWGDPSVAQLASDLAYLRDRYGSDPRYLRLGGRFVVFAYGDANDGCATAQRWQAANATIGAYLVLKVFPGYQTCPAQPDAWHQYAPANREQSQAGRSFTVSPGFWLATDPSPRLARDPACFRRAVRDMVASGAPWQLVTTFNEWGEGTSVEPAQQWATASGYGAYLDALHDDGAGAAAAAPC